MESLVPKLCEELAIADSDAMEFVDVESGLSAWCESKLRSYVAWATGTPRLYIAWAVGNRRLMLPGVQGTLSIILPGLGGN